MTWKGCPYTDRTPPTANSFTRRSKEVVHTISPFPDIFTLQYSVPAPGSRAWDEPPWFTRVCVAFPLPTLPFQPAEQERYSTVLDEKKRKCGKCFFYFYFKWLHRELWPPSRHGTERGACNKVVHAMQCKLVERTNMFNALSPNTPKLTSVIRPFIRSESFAELKLYGVARYLSLSLCIEFPP